MIAAVRRVFAAFSPPDQPPKRQDALRFGILGAANVAPMALFTPAKSHPEVIIQAVAARDRTKAEAYAKANNIAEVKDTYDDLLNDPNIDVIFVPLPNSLHYEWAVKAIKAGKHVLLEKPSVSTAEEAESLFRLPELRGPNAPILMEAFHTRFYPSFVKFRSLIAPEDVVSVHTHSMIPWWMTKKEDIFFNYSLAGGAIMSMGTYNFAVLRAVFGAEPEECISCETEGFPDVEKIDHTFTAKFRFPGGRIGEATSTLKGPAWWTPSAATVQLRPVVVKSEKEVEEHQEVVRARKLVLHGFVHGVMWNRIDIHDVFEVRDKQTGKVASRWEAKSYENTYNFRDAGAEFVDRAGEDYWMSFRYQLEEFVNKVKGRKTSTWVDNEDSICQAKMIDMAYEKSGLGLRPNSKYLKSAQ